MPNPLTPEWWCVLSPEEWAFKISELIKEAEADGWSVWIENECCGCSRMDLVVTTEWDSNLTHEENFERQVKGTVEW